METSPIVLFVNHREPNCGVQQFGRRLYSYVERTKRFTTYYIDIEKLEEFTHWRDILSPNIVVYNYYSGATMPWLSPELIRSQRGRFKQLSIFHEIPLESMGFDLLLHQDPSFEGKEGYVRLTRPIPKYNAHRQDVEVEVPIFGSFGFGLGGKGFDRVVSTVSRLYDKAIIRLNIPYAKFGDSNGYGAKAWAQHARDAAKPGIELRITHDLLPEPQLLDWLAENTANCFFYEENYGRGISGTLDYALAVRRPIAITRSYQFQHVWSIDLSFCVDNASLRDIVALGTEHLEKFHTLWSADNLTACFEHAFDKVLT